MALPSAWSVMRVVIPVILVSLLSVSLVGASQDSGSVIPAESRPCVDCHAFEFMQRALQDLKKTAYNLDTRAKELAQAVPASNREGKKMYEGEKNKKGLFRCIWFGYLKNREYSPSENNAVLQEVRQNIKGEAGPGAREAETLLLRAEKRGLCDCFHAIH